MDAHSYVFNIGSHLAAALRCEHGAKISQRDRIPFLPVVAGASVKPPAAGRDDGAKRLLQSEFFNQVQFTTVDENSGVTSGGNRRHRTKIVTRENDTHGFA